MQVGAVGRKGERQAGAALLLVDPDQCGIGQVGAAIFLRHVQPPQAEFLALRQDQVLFVRRRPGFLPGRFPCENALLQRNDIAVDELGHQILQHLVLFGQLEHLGGILSVGCQANTAR